MKENLTQSGVDFVDDHFTKESIDADGKTGDVQVWSYIGSDGSHLHQLSPAAARHLADVLNRAADEAERRGWSNQNREATA